jgi:hypothetical protein
MLFGCQRSICTEHDLGPDNAPEGLRCLAVEAVEVEHATVVDVDIAHRDVRLCPMVVGRLRKRRSGVLFTYRDGVSKRTIL